jgi:hypothetical protein
MSAPGSNAPGNWVTRLLNNEFSSPRDAARALAREIASSPGTQAEKAAAYRAGADLIAERYGRNVWSSGGPSTDVNGTIYFFGRNSNVPAETPVLAIDTNGAVYTGLWGVVIRLNENSRIWVNLYRATRLGG